MLVPRPSGRTPAAARSGRAGCLCLAKGIESGSARLRGLLNNPSLRNAPE